MPLAVTTSSTTRPKTQPALPPRAVLLCSAQILLLDQLLPRNTATRPTIARPIAATHCHSSHSKPTTQGSTTLPKYYLLHHVTSNTATRPTQSPLPRAVLLCSAQILFATAPRYIQHPFDYWLLQKHYPTLQPKHLFDVQPKSGVTKPSILEGSLKERGVRIVIRMPESN